MITHVRHIKSAVFTDNVLTGALHLEHASVGYPSFEELNYYFDPQQEMFDFLPHFIH